MSAPRPPWAALGARDGHHLPLTPVQRLAEDAATAAELRAYQMHPDVVALRVDRIRGQVEALMWTGIALGLCFTMTTVQTFAAADAPPGSLAWWAAWWLDPMVSLVLLAVLRAEQLTTRYQVTTGPWPRIAKWVLLTATYVMNTWAFWAAGSASGVVLHSVPPLIVVIAAEALTELQYALTDCAHHAARQHAEPPSAAASLPAEHPVVTPHAPVHPTFMGIVEDHPLISLRHHPTTPRDHPVSGVGERPVSRRGGGMNPTAQRRSRTGTEGSRRGPNPGSRTPVRRKLLADYLAEARTAWRPDITVTPAWVRQVTGCSRGLSPRLAAALTADLPTTQTDSEGRAP